eukprot:4364257-Amphidinium_carterae.1
MRLLPWLVSLSVSEPTGWLDRCSIVVYLGPSMPQKSFRQFVCSFVFFLVSPFFAERHPNLVSSMIDSSPQESSTLTRGRSAGLIHSKPKKRRSEDQAEVAEKSNA